MATALKLLTTAGLGVAYLAVALAAAHPRVTPEYDAHYLHRTADCWDPQGASAPPPPDTIEVAGLTYPEACRYLRQGWSVTEDWGAWADPHTRATLRLPPKPGARAVALTLRAAPEGPAIRARFSLGGGREVEEVVPAGATRVVTLPPPDGGADVEIRSSDHAVIPALPLDARVYRVNPIVSRDRPLSLSTRHVGVGLIAVHYLPEQTAPVVPPHAD